MTPLHHAADLCCRDCGGSCWLARAVFGDSDNDLRGIGSRIDALRVLLAAGGDPNARDGLGWTPLHMVAAASMAASSSPRFRFGTIEGVRALLAASSPWQKPRCIRQALHPA